MPSYGYGRLTLGVMEHEYGHYLQELAVGRKVFESFYARNSFLDMIFGHDHQHYFIETDANIRAANFFPKLSDYDIHYDKGFPKIPNNAEIYTEHHSCLDL